ncbi:hypothetical protein MKW94_008234 [Papaver nudicaule]|uniref:snRNA-activating protein complex subunit n=1 Tax=Papaver nudicaule TaxID=74823 RepID=A0AA41V311_PAPNU|nr:hypothetical protein [Papaver nudicaule]
MELVDYSIEEGLGEEDEQFVCSSIARGGPIYIPNLTSPLIRPSRFEDLVLEELKILKAESCVDLCEEDVSVDELKIYTEEELVEKALQEAFLNNDDENEPPCVLEDLSIGMNKDHDFGTSCCESAHSESSEKRISTSTSYDGSQVQVSNPDSSSGILVESNSKRSRKRGRKFDRDCRGAELERYTAKVKQLARLKQKQDEDRVAARLHSFNGSCNALVPSSENIERMRTLRFVNSSVKMKSSNTREHVAISSQEVVLCVEIYHCIKKRVKTQEFLVLGKQTLAELRDRIYCSTDQLMQKEKQYDPSGYFLIEDVFCNDLRDPDAVDYSAPIFDWLKNSKKEALEKWDWILSGPLQAKEKALFGDTKTTHLPDFKAVDMHKIRFCDLSCRLGAGYIYCHQGDCKHFIVLRDMRLIHSEDEQNRAAYPVLMFQLKARFEKCSVCKIYRATKVTVEDKKAQENPSYFCDNCYYLLHYNEDGSLLYDDYIVYDYHHD